MPNGGERDMKRMLWMHSLDEDLKTISTTMSVDAMKRVDLVQVHISC